MPKMTDRDVIRIHVHKDGNTELQKHLFASGLTYLYPGDLFYDLRDITKGRLDAELQDYGVEKTEAYDRIQEVITSEYGTIVKVK